MAVYVSNLQIESGCDFEHLFALGDNDNQTVLNLAGFTASSHCLLYTSPSPRDRTRSRMPSSA